MLKKTTFIFAILLFVAACKKEIHHPTNNNNTDMDTVTIKYGTYQGFVTDSSRILNIEEGYYSYDSSYNATIEVIALGTDSVKFVLSGEILLPENQTNTFLKNPFDSSYSGTYKWHQYNSVVQNVKYNLKPSIDSLFFEYYRPYIDNSKRIRFSGKKLP